MDPRKMIAAFTQLTPQPRQLDFMDVIEILQDKNFKAKVRQEKIQAILNLKKCLSDMADQPGEESKKFFEAARDQKIFEQRGIIDLSGNTELQSLIAKAADARKAYSNPATDTAEAKSKFAEYHEHLRAIATLVGSNISAEELEKGINSIVDTSNIDNAQWIENISNWLQCKIMLDYIKKNSPPIVNVVSSYEQTMSEVALYFKEQGKPLEGADHFVPARVEMIERTTDSKSRSMIKDNIEFLKPSLTKSEAEKIFQLESATDQVISGNTATTKEAKKLNIAGKVSAFLINKHQEKQKILPIEKWILDLEKISKDQHKNDPQRAAIEVLTIRLRAEIVKYEKTKKLDLSDIQTTLSMTKNALIVNQSSFGKLRIAASRFFANLKSPSALKYVGLMETQLKDLSREMDKERTFSPKR